MDADTIASRLLYRDASLLVLDKPAGLPVHRERGAAARETLTDWLEHLRFGLPRPPQIAHRLDRETSGCLALGRHPRALARLSALFAAGEAQKLYWAIVDGLPSDAAGIVDMPIAEDPRSLGVRRMRAHPSGKPALTRWRVLGTNGHQAWLALEPVTGRTHQLRVHCAAAGWPIVGDRVYGRAGGGLLLHARRLSLPLHPRKPPVVAEAPAPDPLARRIATMQGVVPEDGLVRFQ